MPSLRIHHLNCASMHPLASWALEHRHAEHGFAGLVCHCLLIEAPGGLVLVDTGLGLADVTEGRARLGAMFTHVVRPARQANETARRRIEALGFDAADVRHVVLTHLDVDHAGGLPDFPNATVHVLAAEHAAARARRHFKERDRYRPVQWAHNPHWQLYDGSGENWHGFEAVRAMAGGEAEILLVPLAGHTRGHAAIAVRSEQGWLLHAGDAYFHRDEIAESPCCPFGLRLFENTMAIDNSRRRANQTRLRELAARREEVRIFCSHDPVELARAQAGAGTG